MRNGIEIGLLPRGDPYREPRGQSEYGERAGEVLGRGVLVENLIATSVKKVCKILSYIVIHIIEGAILHRLQYSRKYAMILLNERKK